MSKVKIQGNASGTGVLTVEAPNTNTDRTITLPDSTGTLVDDTTAVTKDANGNVGIGTSSPQSKLDIITSSTGGLNIEDGAKHSGAGANITSYQGSANTNVRNLGIDCQNFIVRSGVPTGTTTTERMRIDSSGNLLVNTTSTLGTAKVHVYAGNLGTGNGITVKNGTNNTGGAFIFFSNYLQTTAGSITQSGTTSVSYNTSSDYRLKENVVPMTGSIDRLKALKPSKFNFIADADKTVDGFLAHEAGEVVPECATGEKDAMRTEEYEVTPAVMDGDTVVTEAVMGEREVPDYQGIDQSKLVPLLVASLQEAVAKIEALETRVTQLENA